jgi:predicted AAA+ superfamily ATPase
MIERTQLQTLRSRILETRNFIQVVVGPRQVGKTTMVKQLLEQISTPYLSESADAVVAGDSQWIKRIWETARLKFKTSGAADFLLVIDEIQKIHNWSETIKSEWDQDTRNNVNIKVILLGSSRLLIQQGLTESLAGRFEKLHLGHWTLTEMQMAFGWSLPEYIYFGGYPGSASLIDDETRWKNYVKDALIETSVSKDILMLTRVDKPSLLRKTFELGAAYSGQILSFTKMLGELQDAGNTTTLSHYLRLLSDSGLLGGIEKYAGEEFRRRSSVLKFQVFNNALMTAQNRVSFLSAQSNPELRGRLVESSVGSHLMNTSVSEKFNVYYWREGANEVDFIIESSGDVIALEVKSGYKSNAKGMSVFAEKFKPEKSLIIGNNGIPIEEFLKLNPAELF